MKSPELDRLVHYNNVADLFLEDDPQFAVAGDYASLVKIYGFWNLHAARRPARTPVGSSAFAGHGSEAPHRRPHRRGMEQAPSPNSAPRSVMWTPWWQQQSDRASNPRKRRSTKYPVLVTLFRRGMNVIASFRSRNGEAIKVAEKLQGGGHANASGALLPKSVRNIPEAVDYLKQVLNPRTESPRT